MNPISRFFKGFAHGYNSQRSSRLQRETQARQIQEAKRIGDKAITLKIRNNVMAAAEINFELDRGAKFVVFQYCVSILVRTYKRPSKLYLLKPGDNAFLTGLPFSLISIILGWWGIPFGPIWTIETLITNFRGGKNVTGEIVTSLNVASSVTAP